MLTKKEIKQADELAAEWQDHQADTSPSIPLPGRGGEGGAHDHIATALLRDMLNRNLALAGRMLDIGDCSSAKRLLQSAITQCDQIASYQPQPTKPETTIIEV